MLDVEDGLDPGRVDGPAHIQVLVLPGVHEVRAARVDLLVGQRQPRRLRDNLPVLLDRVLVRQVVHRVKGRVDVEQEVLQRQGLQISSEGKAKINVQIIKIRSLK